MTADRLEHKFLLPRQEAHAFVTLLDAHLSRHRYSGDGANTLPNARHYATTVYFDTDKLVMYRRALASPQENIKLRAREYYDQHPELVETATDISQLYRPQPRLWLELKERSGARTFKQRVGIPKVRVEAFLREHIGGAADAASRSEAIEVESGELSAQELTGRLLSFVRSEPDPFAVSCVLNYRRASWQGGEDLSMRVTIDSDLAVFRAAPELLTDDRPLLRERLGTAAYVEPGFIAEVKLRGAPPPWLAQWLGAHGQCTMDGGKFLLACGHLYPDVTAADAGP